MKNILTYVFTISCAVVLAFIITLLIGILGYHIDPYGRSYIGSFLMLLILGIPGPFVAGFVLKKNGWIIGATTVVITEILLAIIVIWYVTNMFPSSSTQKLPSHLAVYQNTLTYLEGGLAVFIGSLIGSFGEKLGKRGKQSVIG